MGQEWGLGAAYRGTGAPPEGASHGDTPGGEVAVPCRGGMRAAAGHERNGGVFVIDYCGGGTFQHYLRTYCSACAMHGRCGRRAEDEQEGGPWLLDSHHPWQQCSMAPGFLPVLASTTMASPLAGNATTTFDTGNVSRCASCPEVRIGAHSSDVSAVSICP